MKWQKAVESVYCSLFIYWVLGKESENQRKMCVFDRSRILDQKELGFCFPYKFGTCFSADK